MGSDIPPRKRRITGLASIVLLLIPLAVLCVPWSYLWIYHELIGGIAAIYFVLTGFWFGNHYQNVMIPMALFFVVLALDVIVSFLAYFYDGGSGLLMTMALYFLYGGLLSDGPLLILRYQFGLEGGTYAKRMLESALIGSLLMFGLLVLGMAISKLNGRVRKKV